MKKCPSCEINKKINEFNNDKNTKDGKSCYCKSCNKIKSKQWRLNNLNTQRAHERNYYQLNRDKIRNKEKLKRIENPEQYKDNRKNYRMKTQYGISLKEYIILSNKQNNVCLICNETNNGKNQYGEYGILCIDHDHNTNIVRGLICSNCNLGLGYFKDNSDLLIAAANYLIEHNKKEI